MTTKKPVIFFRNDDVRDELDRSLIDLTRLCIENRVPVILAAEPANLTPEVVGWLKEIKMQHPDLIEIIQHGYNHNRHNPEQKMEFGGGRGYQEQFDDIKKGREIMDNNFGQLWDAVFTFPYGTYNANTLKAVNELDYKAISTKIKFSSKARIKNKVGKILGASQLIGKNISYHPATHSGYKFREISVSANLIKKYTGQRSAEHYTVNEIMGQIRSACAHTQIIGVLFHHRFHQEYLEQIRQLIDLLKNEGYTFSTIRKIIA